MAAEARREARRQRILQNSDSRLQKILDSKSSESIIHDEPSVVLSDSSYLDEPVTGENITQGQTPEEIHKADVKEKTVEVEAERDDKASTSTRDLSNETVKPFLERISKPQMPKESEGRANQKRTEPREPVKDGQETTLGPWIRFVVNVILALLLILLSSKYKEYQNFLVPWIVLQIMMFSLLPSRQDISSNWLSLIQVALQLSGIPSHITRALNTIYAFLFLLLNDLPIFIFSIVFWLEILKQTSDLVFKLE